MSVDPMEKIGHIKAIPDGDEYCELAFRTTTEKERKDFANKEANWEHIDRVE